VKGPFCSAGSGIQRIHIVIGRFGLSRTSDKNNATVVGGTCKKTRIYLGFPNKGARGNVNRVAIADVPGNIDNSFVGKNKWSSDYRRLSVAIYPNCPGT
jgi:hypothetical protein